MTMTWRETQPEPRVRLRDNPLARAFARRAMRPTRLWPGVLFAVMGGAILTWGSWVGRPVDRDFWYRAALGLFATPLVLAGPLAVGASVASDRASGLMDFHRASPTTPLTNVVGYMAGNTAKWAIFSVVGLPFVLAASWLAHVPLLQVMVAVAVICGCGVFYAAVAAMVASVSAPKGAHVIRSALLPLFLLWVTTVAVVAGEARHAFEPMFLGELSPFVAVILGVPLAARLEALVVLGAFTVFALRIAARRFASETSVPFSRADALAFVVVTMGLHAVHQHVVPSTSRLFAADDAQLSVLTLLGTAAFVVVLASFALAPRRSHLIAWARRAGDPRAPVSPSVAAQGASMVPFTFALGVVAVALSFASVDSTETLRTMLAPMVHAVGAAVLLPVILAAAFENSSLRHPQNVAGWMLVSLALVLLAPLALAALASARGDAGLQASHIASLSPLFLPFVGVDRDASAAMSWVASVTAIAFFVSRASGARRALVQRLTAAR
jgi:hypothetical protein